MQFFIDNVSDFQTNASIQWKRFVAGVLLTEVCFSLHLVIFACLR